MINGTTRSLIFGSLLVCAAGFSACSDDDVNTPTGEGGGGAGPEGTGGKISSSGGKANVGGGTTTAVGGTTGVAGGTATSGGAVTTAGAGGTTGVGGGTVATGGAVTTAGATGVGGVSTAGAGGTTGVAGGGGTVSTAGRSSVAGSAGYTISAAGAPQWSAVGVAVISVPLTTVGQGSRLNYENADGKGVYYDLTGASLNILACAPGALGGNLHVFFTSLGRADSTTIDVPLSALTNGFTTVSINVPPASGSYDPGIMMLTRIEVEAGGAFGSTWQTPATVVYIDRIWASKGTCFDGASGITTTPCDDTFSASASPLQTSGVRLLTGTTLTWANQITLTPAGTGGAGGGGGGGGQAGSSATGGAPGVAGSTSTAGNASTAGTTSTAGNTSTAGESALAGNAGSAGAG